MIQPEQLIGMDEHARDLTLAAEYLVGKFGWMMLGIFLVAVFKDVLKQFAAGVVWKFGRRYNEDDVVIANGYPGRITRIGFLFTKIYTYDTIEEPPRQGWSWMIPNDELPKLMIWKPLPKHDPIGGIQNYNTHSSPPSPIKKE